MASSSAECGPVNAMKQLDSLLAKEQPPQFSGHADPMMMRPDQMGPRVRRGGPNDNQLAAEFLESSFARPGPIQPGFAREQELQNPFHMSDLSMELSRINIPQNMHDVKGKGPAHAIVHHQHPTIAAADWAADFLTAGTGPEKLQHFEEFEAAFERARQAGQIPLNAPPAWAEEFAQHHFNNPVLSAETEAAFEKAFEAAKSSTWEQEFSQDPAESWVNEFVEQQQKELAVDATDSKEALAQTAGMLLDVVAGTTNPKFKNSKFLDFMKKLRDKEVAIEGNKVVEAAGNSSSWANEFSQGAVGETSVSQWADEFQASAGPNWVEEYEYNEGMAPNRWGSEFQSVSDMNPEDAAALSEAFARAEAEASAARETEQHNWFKAPSARFENYEFSQSNPYLPSSIPTAALTDSNSHRTLTEAILALEAAVQREPQNATAWHQLGMRQQESENEAAAIAALQRAASIDPSNLDTWIGLAVSYTNENYRENAYDALETWVRQSERYQHLANRSQVPGTASPTSARHAKITSMFLEAARSSPGEQLDPEIQVALGILFNHSGEYEKAVDCFEAALSKRPQDYLLWNKLGATLANSNNSARALDAYYNALEINPSFIRARYNLAISCIQLNQYREAAEHLLTALHMQASSVEQLSQEMGGGVAPAGASVMSNSVWNILRMVVDGYLHRRDLAEACDRRDLDTLKKEFDLGVQ
ncbi:hypothetical protein BJ742DRAFT_784908 [Cladochytrium replicatum]|nr:hypothetical protein BJ742DRAFT_784908 [Cladochytrium replicatum]